MDIIFIRNRELICVVCSYHRALVHVLISSEMALNVREMALNSSFFLKLNYSLNFKPHGPALHKVQSGPNKSLFYLTQ